MTAEHIKVLVDVGIAIGSAVATGIPLIINVIKAKKKAKNAKKEEERRVAEAEIRVEMKRLIETAEQTYKQVDGMLKQNGESAGPLKKDSVFSKLLAFAVTKNYQFDSDYWSNEIDDEVKFTKKVNEK